VLAFVLEQLFRDYGSDSDLRLDEYKELGEPKGSIEKAVSRAMDDVVDMIQGGALQFLYVAFFLHILARSDH